MVMPEPSGSTIGRPEHIYIYIYVESIKENYL